MPLQPTSTIATTTLKPPPPPPPPPPLNAPSDGWARAEELERENRSLRSEGVRLRGVLEDFAERECSYGDNCPKFGSRHYQCDSCRAREALCTSPVDATSNPATSEPAGPAPYGDALQTWFGLTRASWLTLPRVLLEAMPPIWQERLGVLLHEFSGEFVDFDCQPYVTLKRDGRFVAGPDWLRDYRRPDREAIARLRRGVCP